MKKKNKRTSHRIDTLIGPGSEMEGVLQCEDNIRIDGHFSGTIESQGCVTIGERAVARSNIMGREVIVAGQVYGDITAEARLTITPTGQMNGDVYATSLIIMEGGLLNGSSHMEQPTAQTGKQAEVTEAPISLQRPEAG
ncbi:polymer-forming cytoskeletal protein [Paenibacillus sp. JCM 10914]|uniref:bactofilin family protein n=1 Tax=Paenibacillus sp. JCM 10914 TaxID=1236974 RepID=UPI0003CC33AE|nr:polymer-forming cytoskeletal protein [Paenibacillus sp. JCM 10914]GAE07335.1 hypothetical protein JCM10914_3558 [Paenibacillus sp. JCM 10914]